MTTVAHLVTGDAGWETRQGLGQLLSGLPAGEFRQVIASIGSAPAELRRVHPPRAVHSVPRIAGWPITAAPSLARWIATRQVQILHAWSLPAALAGRSAAPDVPLVVELSDPRLTSAQRKLARELARPHHLAFICTSQTVMRRLIESGVPQQNCVVIRPGVDFQRINAVRRGPLPDSLGIKAGDLTVITAPEPRRDGGHLETFVGATYAHVLADRPVRLVLPPGGETMPGTPDSNREAARILRLAATLPQAVPVITPDPATAYEDLLAVSNVLVVAPQGDCPTTAIAWAMAAGTTVVGAAEYAVAELIAHQVNGLLFKPPRRESAAPSIARLLLDHASHRKVTEAARGQAYQIFGLRRCLEQHEQVYRNVLDSAEAGRGITDSALSA